jgi:hypothetical protein
VSFGQPGIGRLFLDRKAYESSGLDHGVPILLELVGENSSTVGAAAAKTAEASRTK